MVLVEKNAQGLAIRIFRGSHASFIPGMIVDTMDYRQAVKEIRHQLFVRSEGYCELCGDIVLESSGHLHEQQHRGKGGEISLANSVFVCAKTHHRAHADRNPRFSSLKPPLSGGFVTENIKDGETICMHGARPFDCRICRIREEKGII